MLNVSMSISKMLSLHLHGISSRFTVCPAKLALWKSFQPAGLFAWRISGFLIFEHLQGETFPSFPGQFDTANFLKKAMFPKIMREIDPESSQIILFHYR